MMSRADGAGRIERASKAGNQPFVRGNLNHNERALGHFPHFRQASCCAKKVKLKKEKDKKLA